MKATEVVERRRALLADFMREVWSNGDVMRCGAYIAPSYTIHHDPGDAWERQTVDLPGFMDRVRLSRAPFPDQQFDIREMFAGEDSLAMTWLWHGTHSGDLPGFPATGQRLTMSGATIYYFDRANRITGHWQVTDRLGIYQQLQRAKPRPA